LRRRSLRPWIPVVALVSALLCLPFLGGYPLLDPAEGYYAAAAAESVDAGTPLDLRLNGEPRWEKPPLSYALIQASFAALGRSPFAARLPSVLLGALLVLATGWGVARVAGGRAGVFAAAILASCAGHQVLARAAYPEMGVVLGTATAQFALAAWLAAREGERPRATWALAGIAMGIGFLAKGPSALLLPALLLLAGMLVLPREHRPSWAAAGRTFGAAAALAVAMAAPWYHWMADRHGDPFRAFSLAQMGHWSNPEYEHSRNHLLYFVPVLLAGAFPWIGLLPGSLRVLARTSPDPRERFRLLAALALGTSFLFWSLSAAKLPHYGLVFLPPVAALLALRFTDREPRRRERIPTGLRLWTLALAGLGLLLSLWPVYLLTRPAMAEPGVWEIDGGIEFEARAPADAVRPWADIVDPGPLLLGLVLLGGALGALLLRGRTRRILVLAAAGSLGVLAVLPWPREAVGAALPLARFGERIAAEPGAPAAAWRVRLPSLGFHAGRPVPRITDPAALRAHLDGPERAFLVVRRAHLDVLVPGAGAEAADFAALLAPRFEVVDAGVPFPSGGPDYLLVRER
jgi:4-amino-4-deoxy-L-arabinose transferase-like glycosyltransferase